MAEPITWRNVNGPSLAEASRPLEVAQRSFAGMFDGLGDIIRQREAINAKNWEAGKQNNTNAFLDHLATYQKPEDLRAAIESGALAKFKSAFGNQIDPQAVRTAAEGRLQTLMGNVKQAGEFQNWQTDFNQAPLVDAIKAKLASNDPAVRAQGQQEAAAAQVRQRAELVGFATKSDREGLRFDEDKKQWVRNERKFTDDLLTSKVQRETSQSNAQSQRISANASALNAQTGQYNAQTQRSQFELGVVREMGDEARRNAEFQADLTGKMSKINQSSPTSKEGAETISAKMGSFKDPGMSRMASNVYQEMLAKGAKTGQIMAALNAIRPESWDTFDSTIEKDAIKAGWADSEGAALAEKTAKFQLGRYVEEGDRARNAGAAVQTRLNGLLGGIRQGTTGQVAPDIGLAPGTGAMDPNVARLANMSEAEREQAIQANLRSQMAAAGQTTVGAAVTPQAAPSAPMNPVAAAEARLRSAMTAATGKGYYSAEAVAQRAAQSALADAKEDAADLTAKQASQLRTANAKVEFNQKQADRYIAKGQKVPDALARKLEEFKQEQAVLRERYGIQ